MARSRDTHPLGKCTTRIDVPVPGSLRAIANSIATLRGKTLAQYAREALEEKIVLDAYRMGVKLPEAGGPHDGMNLPGGGHLLDSRRRG